MEKYFFFKKLSSPLFFSVEKKGSSCYRVSSVSLTVYLTPTAFPEPSLFCDINCSTYCSLMF